MEVAPQAGFPALLVLLLSIIIFIGSIYALIALNTGWRFGYWITGASLGGLMVFLSVFWIQNALGPRGEEPKWWPLAVSKEPIGEVESRGTTYSSPSDYPGGRWQRADRGSDLAAENDPVKSSISNCTTFDEQKVQTTEEEITKLSGFTRTWLEGKRNLAGRARRELEACRELYSLLPPPESLPKVDGVPVAVVYDVRDIRYAEESGTLLVQATVVPVTFDRRLTGDAEGRRSLQVGDPVRVVAFRHTGSIRYPAYLYLVLSVLWFAFHLWGLSRAERRKLSPVAV